MSPDPDLDPRSGTTTGGLPYPSPSDPIAQGADAIKALAEALNPGVFKAYAAGRGTKTFGGATASGTFTITLPAGRFTTIPIFLISSENTSAGLWWAGVATSTTQAAAQGYATGGATGINGAYAWIALELRAGQ